MLGIKVLVIASIRGFGQLQVLERAPSAARLPACIPTSQSTKGLKI